MTGEELKSRRQRLGLTPQDLSRLLRVEVNTINGWENSAGRIPRSVRLRVLLSNIQLKRQEMLRSAKSFEEWEKWLEQCLATGSIGEDHDPGHTGN